MKLKLKIGQTRNIRWDDGKTYAVKVLDIWDAPNYDMPQVFVLFQVKFMKETLDTFEEMKKDCEE